MRLLPIALLSLLALISAACESVPGAPDGDRPPARDPWRVEILDAWFVRVDGDRLARDEFMYRARRDCRRWAEEQLAAPRVTLFWRNNAAPQAVIDEMITQLRLAGVQHIELGAE